MIYKKPRYRPNLWKLRIINKESKIDYNWHKNSVNNKDTLNFMNSRLKITPEMLYFLAKLKKFSDAGSSFLYTPNANSF